MEVRFCHNCGNALKEGAKFCGACGTPALQIAQQESTLDPVEEIPVVQEVAAEQEPVVQQPVEEEAQTELLVAEEPETQNEVAQILEEMGLAKSKSDKAMLNILRKFSYTTLTTNEDCEVEWTIAFQDANTNALKQIKDMAISSAISSAF